MGVQISQIERLLGSTLAKYITKRGGKLGLVNDTARHSYVAGQLFKRILLKLDGGLKLAWQIQLEESRVTQHLGPHDRITLGTTKPPQTATADWRILGAGWMTLAVEMALNRGEDVVLHDLGKKAAGEITLGIANDTEEDFFAPDGNRYHDGTGGVNNIMLGLLYYATIDGLNIAEAGATTPALAVAGINPGTYPNWKNGYISPVGSSDGLGTIDNVYQLPSAYDRAMTDMSFDRITSPWSAEVGEPQGIDPTDFDRPERAGDLFFAADHATAHAWGSVLRARRPDDVGYDGQTPVPTYKRTRIQGVPELLIDATYGYGFDSSGTPLWTDRTGSYASGQWKGRGQSILINTRYLHMAGVEDWMPHIAKSYKPEGLMAVAVEGWMYHQLVCRSRKRGVYYVGPYDVSVAAS